MDETFEDRLAAVERALTDGDHDCSALAEGAATAERVAALEADVEELADRVAELEAATQALRGYVGNVRSVNEEVEQRADTALAKAETAHRAATDGDARDASTDRDTHVSRCDRCDRPVGEMNRDDTSHSGGGRSRSRLDELAEDQTPQRDELSWAHVGAETDGGQPYRDDAESTTGLFARIRDMI